MNHVPKAVSDRDPLADWVRYLNYVRSQALHTSSQSRTGSAHCEVIFCSYCAVRADWPMHDFSAHFQNAHARITFRKSFAFTCPQNQAFYADHDPKRPFFAFQKPDWKSFAFTKGKIRLSNQEWVQITFRNSFWLLFCHLWHSRMKSTSQICHEMYNEWNLPARWTIKYTLQFYNEISNEICK